MTTQLQCSKSAKDHLLFDKETLKSLLSALRRAGVTGHEVDMLDEAIGRADLNSAELCQFNSTRKVAIDRSYKENTDMSKCPRSAKVQLLGAGGVARYGK
jgi:hypothetical protein